MRNKFQLRIDTSVKEQKISVKTPDILRRSNSDSPDLKKHRISVIKINHKILKMKNKK